MDCRQPERAPCHCLQCRMNQLHCNTKELYYCISTCISVDASAAQTALRDWASCVCMLIGVCVSCSYAYICRLSMHMLIHLHAGQAIFQCWLLNSEFRFAKKCVQVPNVLSLGGAGLVCSCTLVLGFAEHMSPTRSEAPAQPYWSWPVTKQARSLNSNWATGLWHKLSRQHNAYEQLQPTRDAFET